MRRTKIALVSSNDKTSFPCKEGILKYFFSRTKLSSPKLLLLATFHMDVEFIVNEVLNQIPYDCKTLVIYSPFTTNKLGYNTIAERKNIRFIRARSRVFHPKILLAVSGGNILFGLGSANLTRGGWGGFNQELWHLYGSINDELFSNYIPRMKNCIARFCNEYLEILMRYEIHPASKLDKVLLQNLKIVLSPMIAKKKLFGVREYPEVVHNYFKSFVSFIKEKNISNLRHIHIFSPIHFKGTPSEEEMVDDIDNKAIAQMERIDYNLFKDFIALFPDKRKAAISFYSSDEVDKAFLQNGLPVAFYKNPYRSHLKVVVLETPRKVYMLSGSANFSINAFKKRTLKGGNSELILYNDITGKWPRLRDIIIGKCLKPQVGVDYPPINSQRNKPLSVIDQMEVFRITKKNKIFHELHIYKNPKVTSTKKVRIRYLIPLEDHIEKSRILPAVLLNKPVTKIPCSGSWKTLLTDRPLICSYNIKGFQFCFPVNYDFDEGGEILTDLDRKYEDLFSFFGYKWEKQSTTPKTMNEESSEQDDSEPENRYQSTNDKFYHEWKHIYRTLKAYKKKKDMELLYKAAKLKIEMFLEDYEKNIGSSPESDLLTPVHIKFIKENILTI